MLKLLAVVFPLFTCVVANGEDFSCKEWQKSLAEFKALPQRAAFLKLSDKKKIQTLHRSLAVILTKREIGEDLFNEISAAGFKELSPHLAVMHDQGGMPPEAIEALKKQQSLLDKSEETVWLDLKTEELLGTMRKLICKI